MARKHEDLKGALNETRTAAATYTGEPTTPEATAYEQNPEEEQQQKRKRQRRGEKLELVSFACPPKLLAESRRLAGYFNQTHSSMIQEILQAFVDEHRAELEEHDAIEIKYGRLKIDPTE